MDWRSAPFSRGWMVAVRVLTSTEPFIWEDLSRDAEKSDYEHRRSYDDVQRGEATAYDIHPPSKLDLEREVLARADADFERLFGAD